MEDLSDEQVAAGIVQVLRAFPSVPLPPNAKMPPKVLRSRWGRDECFRGSYSYLSSAVEDGEAIDAIAEPLCTDDGVPIVMFAGEATFRQHPGTVHGAYMSGFREANRYLAALTQQDTLRAWALAAAAIAPASKVAAHRSSVTSVAQASGILK